MPFTDKGSCARCRIVGTGDPNANPALRECGATRWLSTLAVACYTEVGTTIIDRVVNRDLALAHPTIGEFVAIVDTVDHVDILSAWLNERVPEGRSLGLETAAWNFKAAPTRMAERRGT